MYHHNTFYFLKIEGVNRKLTVGTSTFTANVLGMREEKGALLPMRKYSPLVSWYHKDVWSFLKLMTKIDHIKIVQILFLDIWSMLFSGQVSHRSISKYFFWNLEHPVLVQILPYSRKIIYHLLLTGFLHKLISMQNVGHNMLHLQQLPSL